MEPSSPLNTLPKAELHAHVEGTIEPDLARRIAARNKLDFPDDLLDPQGNYISHDFLHFISQYDKVAGLIRTEEDYRDIAYEYLIGCASGGVIYVELHASPEHAAEVGIPYRPHIDALVQGIEDAKRETGIEARIVITAVRHLGPERAVKLAETMVANPSPYVTGFGLAGDEAGYPPGPFETAFQIAENAGVGITIHAGEWTGADGVAAALAIKAVTRLGHGVRAIEDPAVVEELVAREITLECCPTSNVVLGVYPDYSSHPLCELRDAGVKVTLNSDDPPFYQATEAGEYWVAHNEFGLSLPQLSEITRNAVNAAFVQSEVRKELLGKVETWEATSRACSANS